jgi:hypothetical protein
MIAEVSTEIIAHFLKWEEADCALRGLADTSPMFDIRMGEHWRQWEARRVVLLQEDLEALRRGSDSFLCMYVNHWS